MVTRQATVDELYQKRQSFPDVVSKEREAFYRKGLGGGAGGGRYSAHLSSHHQDCLSGTEASTLAAIPMADCFHQGLVL